MTKVCLRKYYTLILFQTHCSEYYCSGLQLSNREVPGRAVRLCDLILDFTVCILYRGPFYMRDKVFASHAIYRYCIFTT